MEKDSHTLDKQLLWPIKAGLNTVYDMWLDIYPQPLAK